MKNISQIIVWLGIVVSIYGFYSEKNLTFLIGFALIMLSLASDIRSNRNAINQLNRKINIQDQFNKVFREIDKLKRGKK